MNAELKGALTTFNGSKENLIPILQEVQKIFGFLSEETMFSIAEYTGVPESRVYAVATFYAQFRFTPIGKNHVMVCRGTACYVRGAMKMLEEVEKHLEIKEGETTKDGEFSLETVACIGACGLSPCIMINEKVEAKLTAKKVASIFGKDNK